MDKAELILERHKIGEFDSWGEPQNVELWNQAQLEHVEKYWKIRHALRTGSEME